MPFGSAALREVDLIGARAESQRRGDCWDFRVASQGLLNIFSSRHRERAVKGEVDARPWASVTPAGVPILHLPVSASSRWRLESVAPAGAKQTRMGRILAPLVVL